MKKYFLVFTFLFLGLILASCGGSSGGGAKEVIGILEGGGYTLEKRDAESIDYYEKNQINDKYDLNVDVVSLYVGYINQSRWVEIIELKTIDQAEDFYDELLIEGTDGRFVLIEGSVVIITFSQETVDLFK